MKFVITDRAGQIELLNRDLMGEHQAIVHYLTHAWTVVRQFGDSIEAISRDEMRHFKWLAHTIVALGGVPDLTAPDLLPIFSGEDALDYDISAEEEAISQYLSHQRDIADERIQDLIGRIIVDERDHRRQFLAMRRDWVVTNPTTSEVRELDQGSRLQILVSQEYHQILDYLMQSFLMRHVRQIGLDAEDRAIDEMKHMSWIAEAVAKMGGVPRIKDTNREPDTLTLYRDLKSWAEQEMTGLVPLIDRIMAHETYQRQTSRDSTWTVGSGQEGGWE